MDDPIDDTPVEEALTKCEEKVEELEEENAHLRNAAETFGDLAERLSAGQRSAVDPQQKQPGRAKADKSQSGRGSQN